MPTIPGFPQNWLEEHKRWHHARHSMDLNRLPTGYGQDFLTFHRAYIRKALEWYASTGQDMRLVAPWNSVPEPIRQAACYDRQAEWRILNRPDTFANSDELGRFIEASGLHGCMHQEAAALYGEPDLLDFDISPRSTVFYHIHGMVDRWWQNWEGLGRFREGMPYWSGRFYREDGEVLHYRKQDRTWWLASPETPIDDLATGIVQDGVRLEWGAVGDSTAFGSVEDGRPFRVWDSDGDGRLEIVFRHPKDGTWWEGSVHSGRLSWIPIRLERTGLPSQRADSLTARSRRKRKIPT
ncbi:hypothetical protein [Cohnella zeiphila]|uniref:Tyrosinase copper-binding domain-containing protein n=1 Tax=Cohnella zeiphila TaxID=2761120 RepID=A0A7X0VVP0_9BACL|nr:hypothetical protein [Cohnella zeiphila]MBB6730073.1 hypothetical protein [Cohnella zeiphila]